MFPHRRVMAVGFVVSGRERWGKSTGDLPGIVDGSDFAFAQVGHMASFPQKNVIQSVLIGIRVAVTILPRRSRAGGADDLTCVVYGDGDAVSKATN
jgi:hypothetical protein